MYLVNNVLENQIWAVPLLRVKMAKNCPKMAEINFGVSHMMNNNILNIFSFSIFSFWYFTNPEFLQNF